jgi:hypothetical protein
MTKYAVVSNCEDIRYIVTDTVYNSSGTGFEVDANAYDADNNPFLIFTDTLDIVPSVVFVTTCDRLFLATGDLYGQ